MIIKQMKTNTNNSTELINTNILPSIKTLVKYMESYNKNKNYENILFICVQHLLFTTLDLFKAFEILGAKAENIYVLGKVYSSNQVVIQKIIESGYTYQPTTEQAHIGDFSKSFEDDIQKLWHKVETDLLIKSVDAIIILDDGGCCISKVPNSILAKYKICAVEQTSSGINRISRRKPALPVVTVATSAVKQIIESKMIAEAVAQKISSLLPLHKIQLSCAVIGFGVIGMAVAHKLMALGHKVVVHDLAGVKSQSSCFTWINNINDIFGAADYIFGCSGNDVTKELDISKIVSNKICMSCSSHDKEFLTLLKTIHRSYKYKEIDGHVSCVLSNGATIEIAKKGYPVNFDQTGESVRAQDIQLTRSLLLGGVLQAIMALDVYPKGYGQYMLSPYIQRFVTLNWLSHGSTQFTDQVNVENFSNINWLKSKSGGEYNHEKILSKIFQNSSLK